MSKTAIMEMDLVGEVGELYLKGYTAREIAGERGITHREAMMAINQFKEYLRFETTNSLELKDYVMDILFQADAHWQRITKEAWTTVEQADTAGQLSNKTSALKLVAQVNNDRMKAFHNAGLTHDAELVEELNRTQENQETLIQLLKDIKEEYPEVSEVIAGRLSKIQDEAEVIEVTREL